MKKPFFLMLVIVFAACQHSKNNKTAMNAVNPTIEEMVGEMVMIGFRGMEIKEVSEQIKSDIQDGRVGGVILFDYDVVKKKAERNIQSDDQVRKLIQELQNLSNEKLLVAVDQEGGRVNRLKRKYGFPATVSNEYLGQLDIPDSTKFYAEQNASLMKRLGFNVNFAPAVDLNINPKNPVIGKLGRSYGADVEEVVQHASIWIDAHRKQGVLSTIKHFPGHGSAYNDSHYGMADITGYWQKDELIPFEKLSQRKGVAIMTAHVVNKELDTFPATLSDKIIKEIVRNQWAFDGVVFSDDLQMAAVNELYDFSTIIEKTINAGVDILVFGNNLKYDEEIPSKVLSEVKTLIEKGRVSKDRLLASYRRIQSVKDQFQ